MEFLQLVSQIFGYILPVLGTVALIILIILGIKVTKLIKKVEESLTNVDATVGNLNKTIEMANKYVEDFGVTAKTVNNVSMSVEAVRYTLEQMIKKLIARWTKEYEQIKSLVLSFLERAEEKVAAAKNKKNEDANQAESEE